MRNGMTFNDVLESVDKMSLEEQETLTEVMHRRIIERKRAALVREIKEAQKEFKDGSCQPVTPSDLMKEILS